MFIHSSLRHFLGSDPLNGNNITTPKWTSTNHISSNGVLFMPISTAASQKLRRKGVMNDMMKLDKKMNFKVLQCSIMISTWLQLYRHLRVHLVKNSILILISDPTYFSWFLKAVAKIHLEWLYIRLLQHHLRLWCII